MTSAAIAADPPPRASKPLMQDSTALLHDPIALRQRAKADGYLYFKHFLPRELIMALRADLLGVVQRHGWRAPGQDALGGRIDLEALNLVPDEHMRDDIGVSSAAYEDAQRLEKFHALPHFPKLVEFYQTLFGGEVLIHPRHIARMITGHRAMVPTPPHQDFPYIQGTTDTWTCWIPLGDCPRSMGGLTVMKGSNDRGILPLLPAKGAGGHAVPLCPWETQWVEADYEAGDILTFSSQTLHKALRCADKGVIRLSLDVRYQSVDQPVEERSLQPHTGLSWDEIYQGWESKEFQYYWRRQKLQMSGWDDSYLKPARRIC